MDFSRILLVSFLFFQIISSENRNFFNHDEYLITISLINHLKLRHCIKVGTDNDEKNNITLFKKFSNQKIISTRKSFEELFEYLMNGSFANVKTIIILKGKNLLKIVDLFENCQKSKILHRTSLFTWLVFLESDKSLRKIEKLLVPYNSQFIVSFLAKNATYVLIEVYTVKNRTFFTELGIFRNNEISLATGDLYSRRMDLNGTVLIMNYDSYESVNPHEEFQLIILEEIARLMNTRYDRIYFNDTGLSLETFQIPGDVHDALFPFHSDFFSYDVIGPASKTVVNWYIKYPKTEEKPDYFIQPFHPHLWACILGVIILGIFWSGLMKKLTELYKSTSTLNLIFLGFESFCNQNGSNEDLRKISFRILVITIRVAALVLLPAYGAEITSYLAIRVVKIPFHNVYEFVANGRYTLAIYSGHFIKFYLQSSSDPTLRLINNNFTAQYNRNETDLWLERFCQEQIAVASTDNIIDQSENIKCDYLKIQQPITYTLVGAILKTNSEFRDVFNYNLIRIRSIGMMKKLENDLINSLVKSKPDDLLKPVEMKQMVLVISIVGIGIILAGAIFIFEFFMKKCGAKKVLVQRKRKTIVMLDGRKILG